MRIFSAMVLWAVICLSANAQSLSPEVVASSGNHFTSSSAQLSWTVGEPVIQTYTGGSSVLTQGFHQTKLTLTEIENPAPEFHVTIYPNPNNGLFNVDFSEQKPAVFEIFDIHGKSIRNIESTESVQHQVDLENVADGEYLLMITVPGEGSVRTYKVIKAE